MMRPVGPKPDIAEELAAFLESDRVAIWIAVASRQCVPQTTRAMGARVDRQSGTARLFVPTEQGARVLENVRPGVALAAAFVRIDDYRAVQIKGEIARHRACDEGERQGVLAYRDGFAQACGRVGMPLEPFERLVCWPCACVEVAVGELFAQTPGPNAGARL